MAKEPRQKQLSMEEVDAILMSLRKATALVNVVAGRDDGSKAPPTFSHDDLFVAMGIIKGELDTIRQIVTEKANQEPLP